MKCNHRLKDEIISKDWSELTDDDYRKIAQSGYAIHEYTKNTLSDSAYSGLYFMNTGLSPENIKPIAERLLNDKIFGKIFRIKGFLKSNGEWYELNAVKNHFELKKSPVGQEIVIVIGENLNEKEINKTFSVK